MCEVATLVMFEDRTIRPTELSELARAAPVSLKLVRFEEEAPTMAVAMSTDPKAQNPRKGRTGEINDCCVGWDEKEWRTMLKRRARQRARTTVVRNDFENEPKY